MTERLAGLLAYAFQNLLHIIVFDQYFLLFTPITVVILVRY